MSQLALSQNHTTDDGLKTAAKYYQQAAGIYTHLKDNVYPVLQVLPTPDLAVSCLSALNVIMLAQAQDCFCKKAMSGKTLLPLHVKIFLSSKCFLQIPYVFV